MNSQTKALVNYKTVFSNLLMLLFLMLGGNAFASTTWYVNGVSGNDSNNCKSPTTACKTIGHAIALASSGDTVMVAAATYTENISISFSLTILGANAQTTIIDGGKNGHTVVDIYAPTATVVLSGLTVRNGAAPGGGGIATNSNLTISNSTVSGNGTNGVGGGVDAGGTAEIQNSILANNTGGNCFGSQTSDGYNLSSDNTCNFSNSGDRNNLNPMLGTLGSYGGPTQTIPLLTGSPAIDAGNPSGCTDGSGGLLKTDQRGYPRPNTEDIADKKGCDMGAFEKQSD